MVKGRLDVTLKEYPHLFSVDVVEEVDYQQEKISSSRILRYLKEGRVDEAQWLLSRPYTIQGTIIAGNQKGREIGFPTANLKRILNITKLKMGSILPRLLWMANGIHQ